MNRKSSLPAPVGGSSLLVIFAVLCMSVFALLALATVQADVKLAEENTKAVMQYYDADLKAEQIVARLRRGEEVSGVIQKGNTYAFSCDVSDTQILSVVVRIKNDNYEVLQWKEIAVEEWNPEEHIKVWGSE